MFDFQFHVSLDALSFNFVFDFLQIGLPTVERRDLHVALNINNVCQQLFSKWAIPFKNISKYFIKKLWIIAEHLEALERGDMKFSSSYDHEIDHFGDSCGSAEEQSEASDSEQDEQDIVNVETVHNEPQYEYIVKEEILSDLDVEVGLL